MPDPIKQIKSHTFCGRKYKFRYTDPEKAVSSKELAEIRKSCHIEPDNTIVGLTDNNDVVNPEIIISDTLDKLSPKDLLRVLLDEGIHACNSKINNDIVDQYARSLAGFLWRCGYRRIKRVQP